jgi:hypothetical protein
MNSLPAWAHQAGGIGGGRRKRRAAVTLTQDTLLIRDKHTHRTHLHSHTTRRRAMRELGGRWRRAEVRTDDWRTKRHTAWACACSREVGTRNTVIHHRPLTFTRGRQPEGRRGCQRLLYPSIRTSAASGRAGAKLNSSVFFAFHVLSPSPVATAQGPRDAKLKRVCSRLLCCPDRIVTINLFVNFINYQKNVVCVYSFFI